MGIKKNVPKVGIVDYFYTLPGKFHIPASGMTAYNGLNTNK